MNFSFLIQFVDLAKQWNLNRVVEIRVVRKDGTRKYNVIFIFNDGDYRLATL